MTDRQDIAWNDAGLAPCIVQHASSGRVLMLGWMNQQSLALTLETELVHFYSRSRKTLWKKGESSGNVLQLVALHTDCDRDAIIALVNPAGPTCHTGKVSCFFEPLTDGDNAPPVAMLAELTETIESRKSSAAKASYTKSLLDGGPQKINEKILEEADELACAVAEESEERVVSEAADLLFHLMVGLASREVTVDQVLSELKARHGTSGHDEKAARSK